ncbi:MAG TPA: hypothetical protein VHL34_23215 [Rhizomicrobium sp.]|jgi:hypothetical protein|nr:hypothetical protein [Rhizomicrobium sp.]
MSPVKTYFPKTRLNEMALRKGGVEREDAIENALKSIEDLKPEGDAAIVFAIAEIGKLAAGASDGMLSDTHLHRVLCLGDSIVSLAGTFAYKALDDMARSLCDLTDGLLTSGNHAAAPIAIHARSLQLVQPGAAQLPDQAIDHIRGELAKLLAHYNFGSLAAHGAPEDSAVLPAA